MSDELADLKTNSGGPLSGETYLSDALTALRAALRELEDCNDAERDALQSDAEQLQQMLDKSEKGRLDIVLFGEIDTGKSSMINALVGEEITSVDVRGGWTKEARHVPWNDCGYQVPGFDSSGVILIDTPGINEVQGNQRSEVARDWACRADLIIFVVDSDLNDTEYSALAELATSHKPILVALNKMDLYSPEDRARLLQVLREDRLRTLIPPENILPTVADPLAKEYIIESADGSSRTEFRKPDQEITGLKDRLLAVLAQEGSALLALNAAMYAADKSDKIAATKIQLRDQKASNVVMTFAVTKAVAVAVNPAAGIDLLGGVAVDITMVITLGKAYVIKLTRAGATKLVTSLLKATGWLLLPEAATHFAAGMFKAITLGTASPITAIPQGAAAGYGSYIVGQAARHYFEHGASWGGESPKQVVLKILQQTDKQSILRQLKNEINKRMKLNPYSQKK